MYIYIVWDCVLPGVAVYECDGLCEIIIPKAGPEEGKVLPGGLD